MKQLVGQEKWISIVANKSDDFLRALLIAIKPIGEQSGGWSIRVNCRALYEELSDVMRSSFRLEAGVHAMTEFVITLDLTDLGRIDKRLERSSFKRHLNRFFIMFPDPALLLPVEIPAVDLRSASSGH